MFDLLIIDVGMLYKRLFNHRPIIQNEVHYFVREFEVIGITCHALMLVGLYKLRPNEETAVISEHYKTPCLKQMKSIQ